MASHETIRRRGLKFCKTHWLWRAVDQHGPVLHILVQSRRNARAAKRLTRKLMKRRRCVPQVMITENLHSYGAAARTIMPGLEHRQHKGLNNRAESSCQPTRRRERIMKRFNSPEQAQRVLATHDQFANLFRTPTTANVDHRRQTRRKAHSVRAEITRFAVA